MNKIEQLLLQSALKVANLENTETKKRKLGDGDAPSILDDKLGAKKKKKKKIKEERESETSASNSVPGQLVEVKYDVSSGDANDMIIKRKKKKKKNVASTPVLVEKTNLLEPFMVKVKEEIYDNVEETEATKREKRRKKLREYVKGETNRAVAVKDVFKDVKIVKANSSGQILAAVSWILKQDIPVSKLNAKFRSKRH